MMDLCDYQEHQEEKHLFLNSVDQIHTQEMRGGEISIWM